MRRCFCALVAVGAVLGGCASPQVVGAGTDLAAFVDQGARRVTPTERGALLAGNTLVAEGVRVHYAMDGTKTIQLDDGHSLARRWRLRDDGVMCEELTVSGVEVCANEGSLYVADGLYRAFRPDGSASALAFRIEPGNALPSALTPSPAP